MTNLHHALDLFGEPMLRRSAHFPCDGVRQRLSRDWGPGPRAFVLGCNPSAADAMSDDPTSRWWNRWFAFFGFGGYDAGNLYPFCTASPVECRQRVEEAWGGEWYDRDQLHANLDAVATMAKRADHVFVCYGAIAWDDLWISEVLEAIQSGPAPWPDLWCWGTTVAGAPKHPLARGRHRIDPYQRPVLFRQGASR
jgi:hypothetical protein